MSYTKISKKNYNLQYKIDFLLYRNDCIII